MPFVCDSLCSVPIMSHSLTIIGYFRLKNGSRIRMHRLFGVLTGMATSATADANQPDQDALKEAGFQQQKKVIMKVIKNGSRIRMHRLFGVLTGMATSATADANQPDQDALKEVGIIASMLAVQVWVMGLQAGRHSCRQRSYIHHISRPKTRLNQAFSEIVLHLLICF